MIKVNLLQNTVERTGVEAVETAIGSEGTRQVVLVFIVLAACVGACVLDYIMTVRANTKVKEEVAVEEKTAAQLQDLSKQVTELQNKNKAVEDRISAIQKLRAEQVGPLRLLQIVDARMPVDKDFRLTSIKQDKDSMILINGYSPSETKVTEFAKNLEFSSGLFSRFSIVTRRIPNPEKKSQGVKDLNEEKSDAETVDFTIKCVYDSQTLLANKTETTAGSSEAKALAPADAAAAKTAAIKAATAAAESGKPAASPAGARPAEFPVKSAGK
jgi:Tfp pilus assembly protein PilN